ncbi:MAG TPA: hypothetical protein VFW78_02055 [Bacteroidia bacterium]|nr:hypothetical protein [Bacteroidia bacterium]
MNRYSLLIGCLLVLAGCGAQAQFNAAVDTPLVSFKNKPTPFVTYDIAGSLLGGHGATTFELRGGLDFKKKVRLSVGWAWVLSDIVDKNKEVVLESGKDSIVPADLRMQFATVNAEYTFFDNDRWQITVPVSTGYGMSYYRYNERVDGVYKKQKTDKNPVAVFGPSLTVTYKLLKWVGVSAGLGYRFMIKDNDEVRQRLSSPIYTIKARIFFDEIYKSVFPKKTPQ